MPQRVLFADTFYWIALIDARDAFHAAVLALSSSLGTARLVTTDEVLTEVLNFFSGMGPVWRGKASRMVRLTQSNVDVNVLPQSRSDFEAALALYESRLGFTILFP